MALADSTSFTMGSSLMLQLSRYSTRRTTPRKTQTHLQVRHTAQEGPRSGSRGSSQQPTTIYFEHGVLASWLAKAPREKSDPACFPALR